MKFKKKKKRFIKIIILVKYRELCRYQWTRRYVSFGVRNIGILQAYIYDYKMWLSNE